MNGIKTNKPLNEEELTEQPALETQPQPVQATPDEVSQAQEAPVEEAPVEDAPAEESEVTSAMFTPPAEGYVPAGWVKIEDLASAVAQVTGDLEAASTAPDVQPSAIADTEATIPAAVEEPEEEPLVQESIKSNKGTLNEVKANVKDHKFAFLICDGNGAASRGGEPDYFYTSECVAKDLKSALLLILPDMLGYDPEDDLGEDLEGMTGEELLSTYSEEVDLGDGSPWIEAVMQDNKVIADAGVIDSMIGDEDYRFDIDPADAELWGIELPDYDEEFDEDDDDDEEFDESTKRSSKKHKSTKGSFRGTLNEANVKDHKFAFLICDGSGAASRGGEPDYFYTSECVAKDLKSALLQILPDMLDYDPEDDLGEDLETMTGDELLSTYSEEVDLGDGSPWIEAVMQDGKIIADMGVIDSMIGDEDYRFDIDPADAELWGIELPDYDDEDDDEEFDESTKRSSKKHNRKASEDFDTMVERINNRGHRFNTMAECINRATSTRAIRERYDGYLPAGSEHFANDDDLVQAYTESAASRRRAIKEFRESLKVKRSSDLRGRRIEDVAEPEVTVDPRFKEALKSSSRIKESTNTDSKSWGANRFQEKAEDKLSWKELLAKGFLG